MISYAQNHEDVMLARVFDGVASGTYVDVGAMDPEFHSVTKHFYDAGWSGINIEPNPVFYEKLRDSRPRDINLNCGIGIAVGVKPFVAFRSEGLSSFNMRVSDLFPQYESTVTRAPVLGLAHIAEITSPDPQFLKIDVEGLEADVLKSGDFSRWRPEVVLVESIDSVDHTPTWSDWEHLLLSKDYEFVYFDGLNRFYLRAESGHLKDRFALPPNIFDGYELAETVMLRTRLESIESSGAIGFSSGPVPTMEPSSGANAHLQEQIRLLTESMQSVHTELAEERLQVEQALARAGEATKAVADELDGAKNALAREVALNRGLQQRVDELEAEKLECGAVQLDLSHKVQELTTENGQLQTRIQELHAGNERLQQTGDESNAANTQLQSQLENLRRLHSEARQELKQAKDALADATSRAQHLSNSVAELQQKIIDLNRSMEAAEAAHLEDRLWVGQLTQERVQERKTLDETLREMNLLRERVSWYERHVRALEGAHAARQA